MQTQILIKYKIKRYPLNKKQNPRHYNTLKYNTIQLLKNEIKLIQFYIKKPQK